MRSVAGRCDEGRRSGGARLLSRLIGGVCAAGLALGSGAPALASGMSLATEFDISQTGAIQYGLPIVLPPGTGGMKPELKLEYSSQNASNGLLGVGWALSGLSVVERCPRTMAQDGVDGGVSYDANDRFCIDGQRLIAISGAYGANGTEYRTEREGFSRIVSNGTAGAGPAWFKVWTKAGQIIEFGNTADSRIEAQGKSSARLWAVNKVQDTVGNFYTVTYTEDSANGDWRPSRMDYTGNAGAAMAPYASVRFTYQNRTDVTPGYLAGSVMKTQQRLTNIKTYNGETLILDYQLAYEMSPATARSRLKTLKLCAADASCLPPATFTYENGGFAPSTNLSFTSYLNPISTGFLDDGHNVHFGDWNGDGLTDMMSRRDNGENDWYVAKMVGGALQFDRYASLIPAAELVAGSKTELLFGDWNGDGLTDVLHVKKEIFWATNRWYVSNGVGGGGLTFTKYDNPISTFLLIGQEREYFTGDWNNDGRTDLMTWNKSNGQNVWFTNNGVVSGNLNFTSKTNPIPTGDINDNGTLYFGDWNGDGLTDMMWWDFNSGNNRWFISNGLSGSALAFTNVSNPIATGDVNDGGQMFIGDWNGDGLSDAMWWSQENGFNRWFVNKGYNSGTLSFVKTTDPIPTGAIDDGRGIFFGDWNGDGKADAMWWRQGSGDNRWYVIDVTAAAAITVTAYNNPITSVPPNNGVPSTGIAGGKTSNFMDWNGDGLVDLMWFNKGAGDNRWFMNNAKMPDMLLSVDNGLGQSSAFTYTPITKGAPYYTKDATASFPVVDLQGAVYGVSRIDLSDGIGGTRSSTYRYAGLKADTTGRGFLGFRTMTVKDEQTAIEQFTEFLQDWPYTGVVARRTKSLGALELNRVENTYSAVNLGGTRRFVQLDQTVETSKDLDGTTMPSSTTAYVYDAFGNSTQVVVTSSDGYVKTTNNTYFNDTTNWFLGRLTRASVTSQTP